MKIESKISIEDFNYDLPDERIAKYPLTQRDRSRLLIYSKKSGIKQDIFASIANHLPVDSLLVFNNTKVIFARLNFRKITGAAIEVFCLKPVSPSDYVLVFQTKESCIWKCLIGNAKRWKNESLSQQIIIDGKKVELTAIKKEKVLEDGSCNILFSWDNKNFSFAEILEAAGKIPIPPYLKRESEVADKRTYQTIYSKIEGSVAAPTAGLHFTDEVFKSLNYNHLQKTEITLHVGAGTFQPVKESDVYKHKMHEEIIVVNRDVIKHLLNNYGRIIAVGTTSVRTLESIYWFGVKLFNANQKHDKIPEIGQWEPYKLPEWIEPVKALGRVSEFLKQKGLNELKLSTCLMILPEYKFRIISGMITNFHQPKSTLLMLIAAFLGESWKDVYAYALQNEFRFLSYGDVSLLIP